MNDVQIIAVWGTPNCGKSTVSLKLAKHLADKGKGVLIIMDDPFCPNLPVVTTQPKDAKSIGALMIAQSISQQAILSSCVSLAKNIAVLGYILGDNIYRYVNYSRSRAEELIMLTRHIFDVIIIDCDSRISKSALSAAALEMSDMVVRMMECTRKCISAIESENSLLLENFYKLSKTIGCYSKVTVNQDAIAYQSKYSARIILPYCDELEHQMETVQLLDSLSGKQGKKYEVAISNLYKELFEECQKPPKTQEIKILSSATPAAFLTRIGETLTRFWTMSKNTWSKITRR